MESAKKLTIKHRRREGAGCRVELRGVINEHLDRRHILRGVVGDEPVVFDLDQVQRITSFGVIEWGALLSELPGEYYFIHCRPSLVAQFNMVRNFSGSGHLVSFYLPYRCIECDQSHDILLDQRFQRDVVENLVPPSSACSVCRTVMEFDEVPDSYLAYARRMRPPKVPSNVVSLIDEAPSTFDIPPETEREAAFPRFGGYRVVRRIAYGGMAEIFLAVGPDNEGEVALKALLPHLSLKGAYREMLRREGRISGFISSENVVRFLGDGKAGPRSYLVLEYVPGSNLASILERCRKDGAPMPLEIACAIVCELLKGLEAVHSATDPEGQPRGIVHRDVSPENVLVSRDGHVKLTDFGAAIFRDLVFGRNAVLPEGKVAYMAPEQIRGSDHDVDHRADVFSAGAILYECLTGTAPFRRPGMVETMQAALHEQAPPLSSRRSEIPGALDQLVRRALAGEREGRLESAFAFGRELSSFAIATPERAARVASWLTRMSPGG